MIVIIIGCVILECYIRDQTVVFILKKKNNELKIIFKKT